MFPNHAKTKIYMERINQLIRYITQLLPWDFTQHHMVSCKFRDRRYSDILYGINMGCCILPSTQYPQIHSNYHVLLPWLAKLSERIASVNSFST